MNNDLCGVLVVDKPTEMTSHDVVAIMRRVLKTKKIGHTGTLDPMATGVLPICVGGATKIVDFLTDRKKAYRCEMILGAETDTQDRWGKVIAEANTGHVDETLYRETILSFVGDIMQVPPMYSALKVNGEKLVDLARKGIVVEREPRLRTIYSIENIEIEGLKARFDVRCSKGTYIRTLCHDIGLKLNTYAHMTALRRILSEPFNGEDAISIETLRQMPIEQIMDHLVPIDRALDFFPKLELPVDEKLKKLVENGVKMDLSRFRDKTSNTQETFYRVYIGDVFYGIAEQTEKGIYVKKLMIG